MKTITLENKDGVSRLAHLLADPTFRVPGPDDRAGWRAGTIYMKVPYNTADEQGPIQMIVDVAVHYVRHGPKGWIMRAWHFPRKGMYIAFSDLWPIMDEFRQYMDVLHDKGGDNRKLPSLSPDLQSEEARRHYTWGT